MSYRGQVPKSQPRTLRSVAETKGTRPAGFDGEVPYDSNAGIPLTQQSAGQRYSDAADAARPAPGAGQSTATDPSPFK